MPASASSSSGSGGPQSIPQSSSSTTMKKPMPQWLETDFKVTGQLGKGAYGCVLQVLHKPSSKAFAMKKIAKAKIIREGLLPQVKSEVLLHLQLSHPNIVTLLKYFEDAQDVCLVLELANLGQLYTYMTSEFVLNAVVV
jgi:serine/threonine protein kinase